MIFGLELEGGNSSGMLKEQGMLILILAWVMQRKSSKFINFKQTGQKTCCLIGQKQLAFAHGIE